MPYAGFGTSTSLSQAEIAAIELAVRVTGQQAVTDLQAALAGVTGKINAASAAFAASSQTQQHTAKDTLDFIETLKKLESQQTKLTDATKAADNAQKGVSNKFSTIGQSALQLSYAIDDLQYGFSAIVNNAPQIALALGGGPGLAGVLGIAFVAVNQLIKNGGALAKLFADGLDRKMVNDLKDFQDELKALEDKTIKLAWDYSDIEILKKKIREVTEAEAAYQQLVSGKTRTQQEIGKRVTEAVVEHGGGDDYETSAARVVAAMQAATPAAESDQTRKARGHLAEAERRIREETTDVSPESRKIFEHYREVARQEVRDSVERDLENQRRAFAEQLGKAAEGKEGSLGLIQGMAQRDPAAFAGQGVGPGFLPGLMRARRDRVVEDEARKNAAKIRKDEAEQREKLDRDAAEEVRHNQQMAAEAARTDPNITGRSRDAALNAQIQMSEEHVRQKTQDFNEARRDKAKDERVATAERNRGIAARQREMRQATAGPANWGMYAQEFQNRTGANNAMSTTAGKQVGAMVEKGEDPEAAMQQTIVKLQTALNQTSLNFIRQKAQIERLDGVVNGFWSQQQRIAQQLMNGARATPPNAVHQPGF